MNNDYRVPMEHRLTLTGRETLTVSGVEDVERFDETGIVMATSAGLLTVTGEGLHIGQLSLEGGELHVDGRIDAISYEDPSEGGGGWLRRLLGGLGSRYRRSCCSLGSPFCWGWGWRCSMTSSGPCAAGGGGAPPCWTGSSAWRRGWRCCSSPCGGGRGSCGSTACWGPSAGRRCSSPASPLSWPRSGTSGPKRRRRRWGLPCCRSGCWGGGLKKWKSSAKTSFIFGENGLQ